MSVEAATRGGGPGDGTAGDATRYLTFTLNGESYALDIFHITEILEYRNLTVVPMTPDFVRGVINLRGRAVPVIDLAIRFAKGATSIARRTSIIIVHIRGVPGSDDSGAADGRVTGRVTGQGTGQDIGILVDAVSKVEAFTDEDIEPAPAFGAGIRADFISGMAKRDNDFIIVLDIDHVLSLSDMADLATAAIPDGAEENGGGGRATRSS
ncbi:chemotaxis protein CheW [Dactylosporangium sp. NPDC005555]|uniref:chemotaxis protein CheW n=1 Tax=Dactylosporangium sp. NPDC005555 TaxID=3154889 RepID=UPI0033BD8A7F